MKPALGRSLGSLLGGPVSKPVPDASSSQPQLPLQQPGPGVRSLLKGQHGEVAATPAAETVQKSSETPERAVLQQKANKTIIPPWYFFAADLLLVAVSLIFIFQCPPGTKWSLRMVAIGLVLIGCCLGLVGAWLGAGEKD